MIDPAVHANISEIITHAQQSRHARDLQTILNQVEHFYGAGWHSMEAANAGVFAMFAALIAIIGLVIGVVVPYMINTAMEKRVTSQIVAQRRALINTERKFVGATERINNDFTAKLNQLEKNAEQRVQDVQNTAAAEIEKQRNELNQETTDKLSKLQNTVVGLMARLHALNLLGEYGTPCTNKVQINTGLQMAFLSMYYYSLAGQTPDCAESKKVAMSAIQKLRRIDGSKFNGPVVAQAMETMLSLARKRTANIPEVDCKKMIDDLLTTLKGINPQ